MLPSQVATFVDCVLLPAIELASPFECQNFGLDYQAESERLRDANGRIVAKPAMLDTMSVPALIEGMRALVAESQRLKALFGDFFFDTWCMGIKGPFRESPQTSLTDINWDLVDPNTSYIDVGAEVLPVSDEFLVGVPTDSSHEELINQLSGPLGSSAYQYRYDRLSHLRGVGGFALYLKDNTPTNDFGAVYAQAYSKVKVPFYNLAANKDRSGIAISPSQIFSNSFSGFKVG
ncbi:uncharacterized protein BYT42DRAFT_41436 [Radiomyces spectabilis]|uniref:uncharacterized protein n=1 Tax=Radiomyces spectabilis TaxID=64574 RepID=UPI0022207D5A|nr:uncharacterized protein BYT42DRAFT_41436 [Radiomyces spectabilis]KAI8394344.1 hypothetical protein BYT42DRAFT_41436 [Radiomyces spectabilis]